MRVWIRDPKFGAFLTLDPGSGMGKKQDPDPGSAPGMSNPDHISQELKNSIWVEILKFFDVDLGSGMEKFRIRDKYPGSDRNTEIEYCKTLFCLRWMWQ